MSSYAQSIFIYAYLGLNCILTFFYVINFLADLVIRKIRFTDKCLVNVRRLSNFTTFYLYRVVIFLANKLSCVNNPY